jgi:hypothetical protein
MSEIKAAGIIILFFAVRCIVPLLITVAIGYLMNRLVDRWEAEAAAEEQNANVEPVVPTTAKASATASRIPCWILRNCDAEERANCPAYLDQSLPCWIARLMAEGARPDSCPDCPMYDPELAIN